MAYHYAHPSAHLRPFVKQFWGITGCDSPSGAHTHRVVPSGMPELILYIGRKPSSDGRNIEDHCLISGQQNDFYDLRMTQSPTLFAVSFHPQGISQFFPIPMSELTNRTIPLKYLNVQLYNELFTQLSDATTFERRVQITEWLLLSMLTRHHQRLEFTRIQAVIRAILYRSGSVGVSELSNISCLSLKQFERVFMEQIGLTPKQYLRIVRFQAAIHRKAQDRSLSLSHLACDAGYYDQPHLSNEFKTLSGLTPGQFFANYDTVSDLFGS
jgi:AraC-like DNA-binding protein